MQTLDAREHRQLKTLWRDVHTLRFFRRHPRLAHTHTGRRVLRYVRAEWGWTRRELAETRAERRAHQRRRMLSSVSYWVGRQIWAATIIGRESAGDPWPNCPDPFDGGGSWYATVQCENGGNWMDSPGYFRCGLQFEPAWERRFGLLCPA